MSGIRRKRRRKFNFFALWMSLLFLFFLYFIINQQIELYALRLEKNTVDEQLNNVKNEKLALETEYKLLHTLPYIEKIAREKMGLTKKGEVPYIKEKAE